MGYRLGEIIYKNSLACEQHIENFKLEGEAIISFPNGCMRMENKINPEEGQKSNYVFWCDRHFPDNIQIEWDFRPLSEPGLAMFWFGAAGINGEDLFAAHLAERTGEYKQYFDSDINAYHLSYFRRKYEEERAFHTCNLRKSKGFHLVCQGADPIPDVEDIRGSYHIKVIKYQGEITFYIEDLKVFSWEDDGDKYGSILGEGKIGFRQMAPLVAEYANLTVTQILGKEETRPHTVYIASDSTAQTYKLEDTPRGGWGQYLQGYLPEYLKVVNKAIGGRSSRSFIEQGRLDEIVEGLRQGDYLLVQFGHNDSSSDKPERYVPIQSFGDYLKTYIYAAKNKKAVPILLTPVAQRLFDETGKKCEISFPQYRQVMLEVARETETQVIDLGEYSAAYLSELGQEESQKLFLEDNTHFKTEGAVQIASIIAKHMQNLGIY